MSTPLTEPYVGAKKEIAFTKETTRGTAETAAAGDWEPHEGFDFGPQKEKIKDEPGLGRIEQVNRSHLWHESSGGNVPLRVTKRFLGIVLTLIFGQAPTTVDNGDGTYTHTWAFNNSNRHQAYTITVKDPIKGFLAYALGMLNEANFELNIDGQPKLVLDMMAGDEEASAATSTSYDTTYEYAFWMPQHITFKLADTTGGLGAAVAEDLAAAPFSVQKNTEKRWKLGQTAPIDVINQRFGMGGTLESVYDDTTLRDLAHTDVNKALELKFDDTDDNVLTLTVPRVSFEEWNDTEDINVVMTNTIAWFFERESGLAATLTNKISSY